MMRSLRLIVTLLLCLTVPVSGWASVMSGPLCPQLHHHHEASGHAPHHAHSADLAAAQADADHHDADCDDPADGNKPCKGAHCDCGCGMGACYSPSLLVMAMMPADFLPQADKGLLPVGPDANVRIAFGASPLRPPIA